MLESDEEKGWGWLWGEVIRGLCKVIIVSMWGVCQFVILVFGSCLIWKGEINTSG